MQYPLSEKIGDPDLFVGREKEFRLLNKWLNNIPKRLSKSRVILARRKSGKTALVQRIFNQLWSENGPVIPFYDRGISRIDFRGLQDGTLNLVLRRCLEKEIEGFAPDFPKEFGETIAKLQTENRSLRGKLSYYKGIVGEHLLVMVTK